MKKNNVKHLLKKRDELLKDLGKIGNIMRGTLKKRYIQCGKSYCHCHKNGGHGPYYYLSITEKVGKVLCEKIPKNQVKEIQSCIKNYNKLWDIIVKITGINIKIIRFRKSQEIKK